MSKSDQCYIKSGGDLKIYVYGLWLRVVKGRGEGAVEDGLKDS